MPVYVFVIWYNNKRLSAKYNTISLIQFRAYNVSAHAQWEMVVDCSPTVNLACTIVDAAAGIHQSVHL